MKKMIVLKRVVIDELLMWVSKRVVSIVGVNVISADDLVDFLFKLRGKKKAFEIKGDYSKRNKLVDEGIVKRVKLRQY